MKTPRYWKNRNITSDLLLPLGHLYNCATRLRLKFKPSKKVDIPVICIGNLTAGRHRKNPGCRFCCRFVATTGKKTFFCFQRLRRNPKKHYRQCPKAYSPPMRRRAAAACQAGAGRRQSRPLCRSSHRFAKRCGTDHYG